MPDVEAFVARERERLIDELAQWCAIPSISARPEHRADVERSAAHLQGLFGRAGMDAEIMRAPGAEAPAVYAQWLGAGPGAPTLTIYGHHDVQPVEPLEAWTHPPFEPVVADGYLHARGASDDKSQVHLALSAVRHLLETDGALPLNVRFLVEGEEELLSPHIEALLGAHRDRLECDLVLSVDAGMLAAETPSITTSLRGVLCVQLDVCSAAADLHSGAYGGTVANAAGALAEILAGLRDEHGRIAIPGWYEHAGEPAAEDRAALARVPFDADGFARLIGVRELVGEPCFTPLERIGLRPAVDVNGIWGGYTGPGTRTAIPAEAHAKLSFRLVGEQDPAALVPLLGRWLAARAPAGTTVALTVQSGTRPCATPVGHPANVALAAAVERVWGERPCFVFEGGSGPQRALADALGAPCVHFGTMLPDDNYHAPNERVQLANYLRGIRAVAHFLEGLAQPETAAALRARRR